MSLDRGPPLIAPASEFSRYPLAPQPSRCRAIGDHGSEHGNMPFARWDIQGRRRFLNPNDRSRMFVRLHSTIGRLLRHTSSLSSLIQGAHAILLVARGERAPCCIKMAALYLHIGAARRTRGGARTCSRTTCALVLNVEKVSLSRFEIVQCSSQSLYLKEPLMSWNLPGQVLKVAIPADVRMEFMRMACNMCYAAWRCRR